MYSAYTDIKDQLLNVPCHVQCVVRGVGHATNCNVSQAQILMRAGFYFLFFDKNLSQFTDHFCRVTTYHNHFVRTLAHKEDFLLGSELMQSDLYPEKQSTSFVWP